MNTVTLTMIDIFTEETITRTIDATNAMSSGSISWELGSEENQKVCLERWINERGNDQHETILNLISWEFN